MRPPAHALTAAACLLALLGAPAAVSGHEAPLPVPRWLSPRCPATPLRSRPAVLLRSVAHLDSAATSAWTRGLDIRGGADEVEDEDGEAEEESEEESEEEDEEEEDDEEETGSSLSASKEGPLRLDETPLDKVLRATQAVGRVVGRHHARLAKNPSVGFVLSNPMIVQLALVMIVTQVSEASCVWPLWGCQPHHTTSAFLAFKKV